MLLKHIFFSALRYLSVSRGSDTDLSSLRPAHHPAVTQAQEPLRGESIAATTLTGSAVFEVARRILEGSHAVPTRLKILLDRALDSLSAEERRLILTSCGWNLEDYLRGYKLKVSIIIFDKSSKQVYIFEYLVAFSDVCWLYRNS